MKRKFLIWLFAVMMLLPLAACGGQKDELPPEEPPSEEQSTLDQTPEEEDIEFVPAEASYPDVEALFSVVAPESELKISIRDGKTLYTRIFTQYSAETAPEGWENTVAALEDALAAAEDLKEQYGVSAAAAELLSSDEKILASGFNGGVKFNKFEVKEEAAQENPTTISKFEYDQISVGMTLSKVREIVGGDGTLQNAVGTAGVTGTIQTYRFYGEKEGSYADILFDDYVVYSKVQIFLE